ncbi:MAG: class I SAM-dependent methyltransferase [Sphingobacteriales bacterium]|jgi:predicted O-methyltransferase YrrM|nr:class I SAM-dependent methyltransferase [Sphingobacteriales bacterium]
MSIRSTTALVIRYLVYWMRSRNRHGIQAPFLYALNDSVWRKDHVESIHRPIEAYRKEMLRSNATIHIRDFGAGFSGKRHQERTVAYITRNSSKPPRYARMLYRLVKALHAQTVLELGTSVGVSSLYMAAAGARVVTVEGCPETAVVARAGFDRFPELKIEPLNSEFDQAINALLNTSEQFDLLFVDGHHQLEPTLNYINRCMPILSPRAVVVVDDINWSDDMREAWFVLCKDPRFTLTVDVFMLGILFRDVDLCKENLEIRY